MSDDVLQFTSQIREFLQTASKGGKIPGEKINNIIGMLENAKHSALIEGKNINPINDLIQELRAY